jgi:hypothetical protein
VAGDPPPLPSGDKGRGGGGGEEDREAKIIDYKTVKSSLATPRRLERVVDALLEQLDGEFPEFLRRRDE